MSTLLLLFFSLFTSAEDVVVPLETVKGIYGSGVFKAPCEAPDMSSTCVLDTGINYSYFGASVFTTLPPSLGKATYTSVTGSVIQCDYVNLLSLRLGNSIELGPLEPVVCPEEKNKSQTNLLGMDAFSNRSFTLDGKNAQLTFLKENPVLPNHFAGGNEGQILMNIQSGYKNSKSISALFDTGSAISTVDIELVRVQPDNFTIVGTNSLGTDAFGNVINSYLVIGSLRVGQVNVLAEYFIAMDFTPFQKASGSPLQAILGYNIISDFTWMINMKDKTWDIK